MNGFVHKWISEFYISFNHKKYYTHTHTYICTVYCRFCHHFQLMWFCCQNCWWLCICKLLKQAWFITFYMNLIQFENFIFKLNIINHVFVPHVHDIFICIYIINLELCSINCDLICNKGPLLLKRLWPDLWKGTPVKTPFVYIQTVTINSKLLCILVTVCIQNCLLRI